MKKWTLLFVLLTSFLTACQTDKTPNTNQIIPTTTVAANQFSTSTADEITLLGTFSGHQSRVLDLAFSPSGDLLASSGQDRVIRIWDTNSSEEIRSFPMFIVDMADIDISPDGKFLASGETIWDLESGEEQLILERGSQLPAFVAFSPNMTEVAVARMDQGVEIWDVESGEIKKSLDVGEEQRTKRMEFSPSGEKLAAGVIDGTVRIWDVESGEIVQTFHLSGETDIHDMAYSANGKYLAATGRMLRAVIWDANSGEILHTFPMRDNGLGIAFSPDTTMVAVSDGGAKTALVFELPSGNQLQTLELGDQAMALTFSPDGRFLAAGTFDGQILLWAIPK